ncbi:winged helix-turn-helix transcriptional regulator [Micromonospora sp. MMS20-R2-23]|uniref:Winged helix-turn-helix transcriptional regulator n=2 Tax=Micromonospora antibiotica TaxID=2807623 RepID=A0ABS3VD06_9ACTN|nr:winged helix-turn-helix transcriptional regulator [Micromonospora antibiotica]
MPQAPLYEQIIADVSASIRAGTLHPDDKLPSIAELRQQYQSSAWPVRYALRILEERGWIVTRQGKGSFVASKPPA